MTPTPQQINKNNNICQIRITKNSKSFKNNINNGGNLNDINIYKNKYLAITNINNNINNKSNIKNILVKDMTTRNKDYLKEKKDINKNINKSI